MSDESSSSTKKIRKRIAKKARKEKKIEESEALDAKGVFTIPTIGPTPFGPTPFTPRQLHDWNLRYCWHNPYAGPVGGSRYFF